MLAVVLATAGVAAIAVFVYLRLERQGPRGVGLATLRVVGLGALLALFFNPSRTARVTGGPPTVLLDASLSMQAGADRWSAALDSAHTLTRSGGTILRFGNDVRPFDASPPIGGTTQLRDALTAARARGGPTVVVTDGEIEDAGAIPPALTPGTRFVLLPRDTVPDAAVLRVDVPGRVQREDSLVFYLTVGTWGALASDSAEVHVAVGDRRLASTQVALPPSPGTARRRVALRPGLFAAGTHVIQARLTASGDAEPRNDERLVVLEVSEQPAIVVVVDPADWEGRFLVEELSDVARTTVRGYARTVSGSWLDMRTLTRVSDQQVRTAVRTAALLVLRGPRERAGPDRRGPVWFWPGGETPRAVVAGDWYLSPELPGSPLAGRLAGLEWDSLAPLTGVVPVTLTAVDWSALAARQGRRGAERPVLVGRDSAGMRVLTTVGEGLWRWRFRGGAAREAYRAILAAGTDWLLAERTGSSNLAVTASPVVQRGMPVVFRWTRDSIPDSLAVTFVGDTSVTQSLRFDANGTARVDLEPGVYRWVIPDAGNVRGVSVVESYSAEYSPRTVMNVPETGGVAFTLLEEHARERWWLFVIGVLALVGEWAWRQRRGLP